MHSIYLHTTKKLVRVICFEQDPDTQPWFNASFYVIYILRQVFFMYPVKFSSIYTKVTSTCSKG
jgi:hypothetical protein